MSMLATIISSIFLLSGAFFVVVGGIGILRMPDFYTRLHASGVMETLGTSLILIGLMFQSGLTLTSLKLVTILLFLFVTNPTACHALAQAARVRGLKPELRKEL